MRPPNAVATEFPANQRPWRSGCSSLRYHIPVIRLNPGETEASAAPSRNRVTMMPVKLCVAAWQARMAPQMILSNTSVSKGNRQWSHGSYKQVAINFPMGKRTMSMEEG